MLFIVARSSSRRLLQAAVCSPQVSAGHYLLYGQPYVYGITGRRCSNIVSGRSTTAAAAAAAVDKSSSSVLQLMQVVHVDSNSPSPDQQQQKTAIDEEREMFLLKRRMSEAYSKGHYSSALAFAQQLEEKALTLLGAKNAVYASCLNNTALMVGRRIALSTDR